MHLMHCFLLFSSFFLFLFPEQIDSLSRVLLCENRDLLLYKFEIFWVICNRKFHLWLSTTLTAWSTTLSRSSHQIHRFSTIYHFSIWWLEYFFLLLRWPFFLTQLDVCHFTIVTTLHISNAQKYLEVWEEYL